jgi:hypothetical protein
VTNRQVAFDTATSQRIGRVVSLTGASGDPAGDRRGRRAGVLARSLQMGSVVKIRHGPWCSA